MESQFDQIHQRCLMNGELWQDPMFPATQASVFYHQTPPFQFVWKRPRELCNDPLFMREDELDFNISPGKLGDSWFVSCVGCLQTTRGLFYRVVPADQTFDPSSYSGVFRFRVFWNGEWVEVLVDDRLPTVNGRPAFTCSRDGRVFWASLLEKACAKLHGSFEALKYGSSVDGLADMTGGVAEVVPLDQHAPSAALLASLLRHTSLVTAVADKHASNGTTLEQLSNGILVGSNYRVLALDECEEGAGGCVVLLQSSLGAAGLCARDIMCVPPASRHTQPQSTAEGCFWISVGEFVRSFSHLEVVHLDEETARAETTLRAGRPWHVKVYQGVWRRGVTAGGCRNNTDTFHINPRLQLGVTGAEPLLISLSQHAVTEPRVVGFTVYPASAADFTACPTTACRADGDPAAAVSSVAAVHDSGFFRQRKSLVNSQYTNGRQVSQRCSLKPGSYIVVPTTFEPAHEAQFTLRVFSTRTVKLRFLDTPPAVLRNPVLKAPVSVDGNGFNQYEAVFLQLADEHKTVNAFELHELLEACLPNDYIKSCATLPVSRQVVFLMDTSGLGRLSFVDFKDLMCSLKLWQTVFNNHAKEKTGVLRAERLRESLLEVGLQLSCDVLAVLVQRFMRRDGTLRFGDFVAAVLQLCTAFHTFGEKQAGAGVRLSTAEWLRGALSC